MIKEVNEKDISECVRVIRDSFATVADQFGFTAENAPKFTAFATTEQLNHSIYSIIPQSQNIVKQLSSSY